MKFEQLNESFNRLYGLNEDFEDRSFDEDGEFYEDEDIISQREGFELSDIVEAQDNATGERFHVKPIWRNEALVTLCGENDRCFRIPLADLYEGYYLYNIEGKCIHEPNYPDDDLDEGILDTLKSKAYGLGARAALNKSLKHQDSVKGKLDAATYSKIYDAEKQSLDLRREAELNKAMATAHGMGDRMDKWAEVQKKMGQAEKDRTKRLNNMMNPIVDDFTKKIQKCKDLTALNRYLDDYIYNYEKSTKKMLLSTDPIGVALKKAYKERAAELKAAQPQQQRATAKAGTKGTKPKTATVVQK